MRDNFDDIVAASAEVKRRHRLDDVKMVLITNASMFHRPHVQRGLRILDAHHQSTFTDARAKRNLSECQSTDGDRSPASAKSGNDAD